MSSNESEQGLRADTPTFQRVCMYFNGTDGCKNGSQCPYRHVESLDELMEYKRAKRALTKARRRRLACRLSRDWAKELTLPWTNTAALQLLAAEIEEVKPKAKPYYTWPLPAHQPLPCKYYAKWGWCHNHDECPQPHFRLKARLMWRPVKKAQ